MGTKCDTLYKVSHIRYSIRAQSIVLLIFSVNFWYFHESYLSVLGRMTQFKVERKTVGGVVKSIKKISGFRGQWMIGQGLLESLTKNAFNNRH